jgi:hypothetical protein
MVQQIGARVQQVGSFRRGETNGGNQQRDLGAAPGRATQSADGPVIQRFGGTLSGRQ